MSIKNWKVQDMYYLAKKNGVSLPELLEKEDIIFNCRGAINLNEFPTSMLSVEYSSPNTGIIFEINSGLPKKVGECKRISWTKGNRILEDDTWEVFIDTDLIEYRSSLGRIDGLIQA